VVRSLFEETTVHNDSSTFWGSTAGPDPLKGLHSISALDDHAEDDMLSVEPCSWSEGDEELRAIRVWSRVCHGKHQGQVEGVIKVFVLKRWSVNGLPPSTVTIFIVTALGHETWNNSVEVSVFVGLVFTKRDEILDSLWRSLTEETKDKTPYEDAIDINVKEDFLCHSVNCVDSERPCKERGEDNGKFHT
jgi:hypothetical protein